MQDNADNSQGVRPGILLGILAVVAVLIGAVVLSRKGAPTPEPAVAEAPRPPDMTPTVTPPPPAPVAPAPRPVPPPKAVVPAPVAQAPAIVAVTPPPDTPASWEQRIDGILGNDQIEDAKKADELLALYPTLPEDGQLEAIQHISNLLPDDRYAAVAPMLINAQTSEGVLEVLLTDLLNRPNELKLPTLLQVARTPDHPKASDALDILEVFVDGNHGNDWAKWEAEVQKYLKENPE